MTQITKCGRCGSKIVESPHSPKEPCNFTHYPDSESVETEQIILCSMCLDDIWEFVFETEVDRSDKADPLPVDRLGENVERHIDDLESVLESLEATKPEGSE